MTPSPKPRQRSDFHLRFVLDALEGSGLVSPPLRAEAESRAGAVRTRLLRERGGPKGYDLSPVELAAALAMPSTTKVGESLDEDLISEAVSRAAGVAYRKVDPLKLDMQLITRLMSRPYAERHAALPLEWKDGLLVVAVANPFDRELVESLRQLVGAGIEPVLSAKADILRSIEHVYGFNRSLTAMADGQGFAGAQLADFEQLVRISGGKELDANDRPVVAAVDHLLRYAFEQRASDVHLEPRRASSDVRLRIDGVLHKVYALPHGVHAPVVSRLKMLARMDIAEKRRPQDGRIKTERHGREVELRVSTVPTAFGEKLVLRVFDPEALAQDLSALGFLPDEQAVFESWIARPHGMLLVTGPTGSGKTTTLYSALRAMAGADVNVTTIEDPIEMVFEGLNQIQVQPRIDLDFAAAIRHVLRQDPDIIMVGEIRDRETASAAIQAALTGHLVLSTLHTNSAAEAVVRLRDLGVEPFLIASSLVGVMAQRLVRTVCAHCGGDTTLATDEVEALGVLLEGEVRARRGAGCPKCRMTGFLGRSAIFELLTLSAELREVVASGATLQTVEERARKEQGMRSLRESGARKVASGQTTVDEVLRATTL